MNEKEFISKKTGNIVWEQKGAYYWFEPHKLPIQIKETPELSSQAQKTMAALARLDGLTLKFTREEIALFQTPFMIKEAQLSSEIEGTRSTISDVYKEEKIRELDPEKRLDNEEIRNYKSALIWAIQNIPKNFSEEYLRTIHEKLLQGVRGNDKTPGQYKEFQNAIGKREDTLDTAKFVPASPEKTQHLMKNFVDHINTETLSALYKIGQLHYQFEAIHPFRDGNGRLGRMLIVLQLCKENILQHPLLYISEYLTKNRDTYIELLYNTSAKGEIENWLMFFLKALENQAKKSLELLKKIDEYKRELHETTQHISSSPKMHLVIEHLFKQPFFTVNDIKKLLQTSQPTVWNLIRKLINVGVVKEYSTERNAKVYLAEKIILLLEDKL
ncbi:MAG: Fic family protein [Candidatus Woesearchaeota archaeon]|nr:MAG: Fic family protein [Candidatus Woesearchaeota archaeon]